MEQGDLATALGRRFIERRDVKAMQFPNGHYEPVVKHDGHPASRCPGGCPRAPWMMADLHAHLAGTQTFGHYLVGTSGNVKLFAFDIDLNKTGYWLGMGDENDATPHATPVQHACNPREVWLDRDHPGFSFLKIQLRTIAEVLARRIADVLEIPVAVAYSGGKGVHVYGFCGEAPAAVAMELAHAILLAPEKSGGPPAFERTRGQHFWQASEGRYANISIETFPKQDSLEGKDLGNLMRLPLGINRKTGHQSFFMDLTAGMDTFKPLDPTVALEGILP